MVKYYTVADSTMPQVHSHGLGPVIPQLPQDKFPGITLHCTDSVTLCKTAHQAAEIY